MTNICNSPSIDHLETTPITHRCSTLVPGSQMSTQISERSLTCRRAKNANSLKAVTWSDTAHRLTKSATRSASAASGSGAPTGSRRSAGRPTECCPRTPGAPLAAVQSLNKTPGISGATPLNKLSPSLAGEASQPLKAVAKTPSGSSRRTVTHRKTQPWRTPAGRFEDKGL